MGTMPPPQVIPSSYQWGTIFDFIRRRGANAASLSAADQLTIIRKVSSFAYMKYLWPFTMATTPLGSIQCVNGQQDYPMPDDCYRLSRAWFYVPTQQTVTSNSYGPIDDPSLQAYVTTQLSVEYVNAQANGGGTPAGIVWPPSGTLDVVKRLPVDLTFGSYVNIRAITQQPNQNMFRLERATTVSSNQTYSLEAEYQISRPIVNTLTETCWFPDEYIAIAEEGILYELYRYTNDARAGGVTFRQSQPPVYSGQLAVWMNALEMAAAADRDGSVDSITPSNSLGSGEAYNSGWPY